MENQLVLERLEEVKERLIQAVEILSDLRTSERKYRLDFISRYIVGLAKSNIQKEIERIRSLIESMREYLKKKTD